MVRFPGVYRRAAGLFHLLPPRARLRRALLRRAAFSGWSAWARNDLDVMLLRYASDCRFESPPELMSLGLGVSHGHAGAREQAVALRDSWEGMDITPAWIVDAESRFVVLGHVRIRGRESGVELSSEFASAYWVRRGLVVRQCPFLDWDEALRTAGLDPKGLPVTSAAAAR